MKVLFVTPSEISSGETITAHHMANTILRNGDDVYFLASKFASFFLKSSFRGRVVEMDRDIAQNRKTWTQSIAEFRPDVVVFADYSLLFFSSGVAPLADENWAKGLDDLDATIATLDHLGYAQRKTRVYFGPPHLSFQSEETPELPDCMHVLLPCPVQEPGHVTGRTGIPFRYWELPFGLNESEREAVRRAYLKDATDLLIFHSTPNWAVQFASNFNLPHYSFLIQILGYYLADSPCSATVLSVNNGELLKQSSQTNLRVINLPVLPRDQYEKLLHSCDLMITDNSVSVSLGRAVCSQRPSAVICNSYSLMELLGQAEEPLRRIIMDMERFRLGSIFPYEVFPIWNGKDLDELKLFEQNSLKRTFARVELFGGEVTREQLWGLLLDEKVRESMRSNQRKYVSHLASLPDACGVLQEIAGTRPLLRIGE